MVLTNKKIIVIWASIAALYILLLVLGRQQDAHPMSGVHQSIREVSERVSTALVSPSEDAGASGEMSENNGLTSLTVITKPVDARVRVMNIAPVYEPGMQLEPGSYDIEVSAPGQRLKRRWVKISGSESKPTFNLYER